MNVQTLIRMIMLGACFQQSLSRDYFELAVSENLVNYTLELSQYRKHTTRLGCVIGSIPPISTSALTAGARFEP